MSRLHVLLMIPAVIALWTVGTVGLLFSASALKLPGVNEHGTGLLFLYGALIIALVGATTHVIVNLVGRRNKERAKAQPYGPLSSLAMVASGAGAIGLGLFLIAIIAGKLADVSLVMLIPVLLVMVLFGGGAVLVYAGVQGLRENGAF